MMYFVLKTGVYEWKGMETIMYKCCIFDLDGTLVNSIHAIQRSVDLSLEKWGMRKITVDECRVFVGDGYKKLLERALAACGDSSLVHYEEAVALYPEIFKGCCMYRVKAYDGITKLLDFLKENHIKQRCCPISPTQGPLTMWRAYLEKAGLTWSTGSVRTRESRRNRLRTACGH